MCIYMCAVWRTRSTSIACTSRASVAPCRIPSAGTTTSRASALRTVATSAPRSPTVAGGTTSVSTPTWMASTTGYSQQKLFEKCFVVLWVVMCLKCLNALHFLFFCWDSHNSVCFHVKTTVPCRNYYYCFLSEHISKCRFSMVSNLISNCLKKLL